MLRVAIVHEWLAGLAGSEKVVEQFCALFPDADLFVVYADRDTVVNTPYLASRRISTSFIQDLPFASKHFRKYLALMPLAIEQFDLSSYDLIISSNHAVAKGVLTGPDQLHISYVHSPIRYAWDLQHQYLKESNLQRGLKGRFAQWTLHKMRIWDYRTASGVDSFVANSSFVARRIKKVYGRSADVIYPPVDIEFFCLGEAKQSFYLAASRLVPYKRMDLIVDAFSKLPSEQLVVVGDGPEMERIRSLATPNVKILGHQSAVALRSLMQRAIAFVFAAEEDFGIAPVEAQACGTPVIAFAKGGALETVVAEGPSMTGVFFAEQTVASVCAAVRQFQLVRSSITPEACRSNAEKFSTGRFRREFSAYVETRLAEHDAAARRTL